VGGISVISPWFLLGLGGLAAAGWVLWRPVRRRRRSLARLVLTATVLLSTLDAASGVNAYYAYLPTVGDVVQVLDGRAGAPVGPLPAGPHPRGMVAQIRIPDLGSGFGSSLALAYLPAQYFTEPGRRFPVVYLVHGSPGVPADWFHGGEAEEAGTAVAATGQPAILLAPRMSRGWLDDPECVDGLHERVETHFLRDVIPAVDAQLRTVASRDGRVLGGMSAGGYCALNLGLRHRDLVATIIDMSGDVAPTHAHGVRALFGADSAAVWANSPIRYAAGMPADPPTRIWFDCGRSDGRLLTGIVAVSDLLAGRGIAVQVHVRPGGHTFHVWRPALRDALRWAVTPPE
jgi:enterochelin esterase-like enzyme